MIILTLLAASAMIAPANIGRIFVNGEKLSYHVASTLNSERRSGDLRTWIPEDLDIGYDFTTEVQALKADGIAQVHYKRPTMTIVNGETFDSPPKTNVEKVNYDLIITASPINEILEAKDIAKKVPPVKKSKSVLMIGNRPSPQLGGMLDQFVQEIYRLALFTGSFDSALDFSPRLKSATVNVGDTWQKTVGYSPQKKTNNKKTIVQRLDYNYTYVGPVTINGKKFEQVKATLDLNSDLSEFINDTFEVDSATTGLKKLPLHLKATIVWNLDPTNHYAVRAEATSEGGYEVYAAQGDGDAAALEERIKGRTVMSLSSRTLAKK